MNDSILLAYARAMRSAQRLEGTLKLLFSLFNVFSGLSTATTPLTDDELEALLSSKDTQPMGNVLRGLLKTWTDLGLAPFPENAAETLWATIQTRNFVAHRYFPVRSILAKDPNSLPTLIAELELYSDLFNSWVPVLEKGIDMLIKALGFTEDELKELQSIVEEEIPADVLRMMLADLQNQFVQFGIVIPAPPPQQPH